MLEFIDTKEMNGAKVF